VVGSVQVNYKNYSPVLDGQSTSRVLLNEVYAALPDPDIFARLKGLPVAPPDPATRARRHLELILAFHRQLVEHFPAEPLPRLDGYAAIKMHTHLFRYFNGRPGAAKLRARLNAVRTLDEIYSILKEFEQT